MKNLIIINGTMGVGKTSTCEKLNKILENSVWLDGDWCWMMDPFVLNDETKAMVIDNMVHMLRNYLKLSHIENIIFNWVIDKEEIYNLILEPLKDLEFNLHKITLVCSDEVLVSRIKDDIKKGKRDIDCIDRSLKRQELYKGLKSYKIDTSSTSIDDNIKLIEYIIKKEK